jgi:hypothetical protein
MGDRLECLIVLGKLATCCFPPSQGLFRLKEVLGGEAGGEGFRVQAFVICVAVLFRITRLLLLVP